MKTYKKGIFLIYGNEGSGFVISANFPEYMQYFYDQQHWGVEEAYKAYGPNMKTVYDLNFWMITKVEFGL